MGSHRAHRAGGTRTTSPGKKKMGEVITTLHLSEGLAQMSKQPCLVQARRTELRFMLDQGLSERQRIRPNVRKKSSEHPLVFHRLLETAFPPFGDPTLHTLYGFNMATSQSTLPPVLGSWNKAWPIVIAYGSAHSNWLRMGL